jgi:hypothetical protein
LYLKLYNLVNLVLNIINNIMDQILDKLHNFSFDVEFNDVNIHKLNLAKKIKPAMFQFMCIEQFLNNSDIFTTDDINNYIKMQKNIIKKIGEKIKIEHYDEVDLIKIYTNKLNKYVLNMDYDQNNNHNEIIDKIYNIVNTPLEGEMAKHNKIKVITFKLIKKNDELDVIFYVKYKECEGYNKQFNTLIANVLESIKQND